MSLRLRSGVVMTETDYGIALLDQTTGEYWTLNPTAALVLRTLLDGESKGQAVHALTARYDVDPGEAARDVERVYGELRTARLLSGTRP
ncbi:lasso peptide biosynthesis PqqD family chaperone [Streptomyces hesseae]|uniref:Lasso peptide biosynthesis PqqD family chaperone n=1 Tax=Streptomyces hesseae TaxID=3075519 RepID=A0ABU2SP23_9ACTN|nr:lasso peptide biosynthesis PqqD family chaperone [Streptomyces sp. DSM 40473]MDT0450376.1 lasso peptide biosynthesis PqqD family chaperone [Streptomyces sp. DSM 40473]